MSDEHAVDLGPHAESGLCWDNGTVINSMEVVNLVNEEAATLELETVEDKTADQKASLALEKRVQELEADKEKLAAELLERNAVMAKVEKENSSFKRDVSQLEIRTKENERDFDDKMKIAAAKITDLQRRFINANREKESMVVKYAMREKDIIVFQQKSLDAEKKMKAALKEKEDAQERMKAAVTDKSKFQMIADSRLQDVSVLRKDIERWKEEVHVQESKAACHASRLKAEVDAHRETREQLDKTMKHLTETKEEIDETRRECKEYLEKLKADESEKQKIQMKQVKQQSAKLIIDQVAATELMTLREKFSKMAEENGELSRKLRLLESAKSASEEKAKEFSDTVSLQKTEIASLLSQVGAMENLKAQLEISTEDGATKRGEVEKLEEEAVDLRQVVTACRTKEAELLKFTRKLTEKNVTLQSDLSSISCRAEVLESEREQLTSSVQSFESRLSTALVDLEQERRTRTQETELLVKKLAEASKQMESLRQRTVDAENEVHVLKRKHASSLRQLTRELQQVKGATANGDMHSSRTSSSTSLNHVASVEPTSTTGESNDSSRSNLSTDPSSMVEVHCDPSLLLAIPPDQALVDKLVRLQGNLARKQDKIEFLEEHVETLVEDIKKKNKIIQNYILKQEAGTLSSTAMDENKLAPNTTLPSGSVVKRKLSEQGGGIMSSLYTTKATDSGLTMELCLEINKKLQAVLEDTLLKNITLKENINTLGNEIASMAASERGS